MVRIRLVGTLVQWCKEVNLLDLSCDSVVIADFTLGAKFNSCEKYDSHGVLTHTLLERP